MESIGFEEILRVAGNMALKLNWKKNEGRVLGLFCFDKKFLSRPDMSFNRFQLFINSLIELRVELKKVGSDLLVLDTGPDDAFQDLFLKLKANNIKLPAMISWNRDYEPFAIRRDERLVVFFEKQSIKTYNHRDHLLIEPHELNKGTTGKDGYQVYSPFARKWLEIFNSGNHSKAFISTTGGS